MITRDRIVKNLTNPRLIQFYFAIYTDSGDNASCRCWKNQAKRSFMHFKKIPEQRLFMRYFDLHIEATPVEKVVEFAEKLGYAGIGVKLNEHNAGVAEKLSTRLEIIPYAMIQANSKEELKHKLQAVRNRVELVLVKGGVYEVNRAACEDSRVDVLCHPYHERNDAGIDHICAKAAHENNVAIEVNFSTILNSPNRAKTLTMVRRMIELCKKYDVKIVTTSGARSVWEMRAPRELAAITHVLGLDIVGAIESVSAVPERIVVTNRERLRNKRIGNYLRVVSEGDSTSGERNGG